MGPDEEKREDVAVDPLAGKTEEERAEMIEEAKASDEETREAAPEAALEAAPEAAPTDEPIPERAQASDEEAGAALEDVKAAFDGPETSPEPEPPVEQTPAGYDAVKAKAGRKSQVEVVLTVHSSVPVVISFKGNRVVVTIEERKMPFNVGKAMTIDELAKGLSEFKRLRVKVLQPFGALQASRLAQLANVKVGPDKPLRWEAGLKAGDIPSPDMQYIDMIYFGDTEDDDEVITVAVPTPKE